MSSLSDRRKQALEACEKVINGIEDGTITVSSALLLCMKIARLVNDEEGQEWLRYEYGGYPTGKDGKLLKLSWQTGIMHGRMFRISINGTTYERMFTQLCGALEASIESKKKAIGNFTTQGYSVSGEQAVAATSNLAHAVSKNTEQLLQSIETDEMRLSILKAQYYDYAAKWQIELLFGNSVKSIFEEYQEKTDLYFSKLPSATIQKLSAIESLMEDGNPERYAQVLASCRRLWSETAKALFEEVDPKCSSNLYKTWSGKEVDISGDHYNNQLSAVIETLQTKAAKNTLVGSETIYLIDWMEQVNDRQSTGVHHNVTREQAMQCIIHTYIALGDILSLKADAGNSNHHVKTDNQK